MSETVTILVSKVVSSVQFIVILWVPINSASFVKISSVEAPVKTFVWVILIMGIKFAFDVVNIVLTKLQLNYMKSGIVINNWSLNLYSYIWLIKLLDHFVILQ